MASSGDVEVVLESVEVEQLPVACDGERSSPATATTEESQPMLQEQQQQWQHGDMATVADHHEAVAAPEQVPASASASEEPAAEQKKPTVAKEEAGAAEEQESTRERLKRHRREMAGRVWVPEKWGQEKLLKDWVDCAVFDRPLVPAGLLTARRALIAECSPDRTSSPASSAGSSPLRVRNGCS